MVRQGSQLGQGRQAQRGYEAARWLRNELKLGRDPIENEQFASVFAVAPDVLTASVEPPMTIGSRVEGGLAVALQPRSEVGRRFELARVPGDDAFYKGRYLAPGNEDAHAPPTVPTSVFAAEFLCPIAGFRDLINRERSETIEDDIAQHFQVSTMVEHQLQN